MSLKSGTFYSYSTADKFAWLVNTGANFIHNDIVCIYIKMTTKVVAITKEEKVTVIVYLILKRRNKHTLHLPSTQTLLSWGCNLQGVPSITELFNVA